MSTVAMPKVRPIAGIYRDTIYVTLKTRTPGASVYYTIDETTPSSGSTLFVNGTPIEIAARTYLYEPIWLETEGDFEWIEGAASDFSWMENDIYVSTIITLKAIAIKTGWTNSSVLTALFVVADITFKHLEELIVEATYLTTEAGERIVTEAGEYIVINYGVEETIFQKVIQ